MRGCWWSGWLLLCAALALGTRPTHGACVGDPSGAPVDGKWDCLALTSDGDSCNATCNAGFTSEPAPSARCVNSSWVLSEPLACRRVCRGLPAAPLPGGAGSWPASCADRVLVAGSCVATCPSGFIGAPLVHCVSGGNWEPAVTIGKCARAPGCAGLPSAPVTNGDWPLSCADSSVGFVCTAKCQERYGGRPTSVCLDTGTPLGQWSAPDTSCSVRCPALPRPVLGCARTSCMDTTISYCAECATGYQEIAWAPDHNDTQQLGVLCAPAAVKPNSSELIPPSQLEIVQYLGTPKEPPRENATVLTLGRARGPPVKGTALTASTIELVQKLLSQPGEMRKTFMEFAISQGRLYLGKLEYLEMRLAVCLENLRTAAALNAARNPDPANPTVAFGLGPFCDFTPNEFRALKLTGLPVPWQDVLVGSNGTSLSNETGDAGDAADAANAVSQASLVSGAVEIVGGRPRVARRPPHVAGRRAGGHTAARGTGATANFLYSREINTATWKRLPTPSPPYVDHRDIVTSVKNQAACNTCGVFSALGLVESAIKEVANIDTDLSEQSILDCMANGNTICDQGSWPNSTLDFTLSTGATLHTSSSGSPVWPNDYYTAGASCPVDASGYRIRSSSNDSTGIGSALSRVRGWMQLAALDTRTVPTTLRSSQESTLTSAVQRRPIVAVLCGLDVDAWQHSTNGQFDCSVTLPNQSGLTMSTTVCHAVLIVGIMDSGTPQFPYGYWVIKNSWGPWWGNGGYAFVPRNCAIIKPGAYPAYGLGTQGYRCVDEGVCSARYANAWQLVLDTDV